MPQNDQGNAQGLDAFAETPGESSTTTESPNKVEVDLENGQNKGEDDPSSNLVCFQRKTDYVVISYSHL